MSSSILDHDAIVFAARFYRNVADGQSVGSSFEAACTQLELDGLPGADLPVLVSVDGLDPVAVRLVVRPA